MEKRVIVAIIMIAALLGAFALRLINIYGVYIFDLLIGGLSIFCALEFSKLLNETGSPASQMAAGLYPSFMFAGHMFYFVFALDLYIYAIIQLSLLIVAFLITFFVYLSLNTKTIKKTRIENNLGRFKYASKVALKSFLTFIYPSCFLLCLMILNRIDFIANPGVALFSGNLGWIVLTVAFLIPVITDTTAMFGGMLFKGPKLCPKISPKKTVAGAISAVVLTSIITGAIFYVFNAFGTISSGFVTLGIKVWHFILLGFFGAIVCQLGDLFESLIKRKAKVKDSGNIFPGHGGFLDRLDSHIFNAPYVLIFFILAIMI